MGRLKEKIQEEKKKPPPKEVGFYIPIEYIEELNLLLKNLSKF